MFPTLAIFKASPVSQPFKRAQLGLFQGKSKRYGNNVPHSKHKTRRTWLPNVQRKRLSSEALGKDLRVKVTTRALRTIKKVRELAFNAADLEVELGEQHGGVDNYLLRTRHDLLGWEGLRLRTVVREALHNQAEVSETPEQKSERELSRRTEQAKETRNRELMHLHIASRPTLATARAAREKAVKALDGEAKPGKILEYLKKQRKDQKSLLGFPTFNTLTTKHV
ncbi:hypothetical protein VNI00_004342 [Paramarasmius palmivorus]|uniref:Large ribosomal subunit protein bL28c n=1 Tax=Paramarasmius palmivorus TaxID=297713 RepID=A0AAW0DKC0_9AGAR